MGLVADTEMTAAVLGCVQRWRLDPDASLVCPSCSATGLRVEDRSTLPYAHWHHVQCPDCGFEKTLNVPLGINTAGSID